LTSPYAGINIAWVVRVDSLGHHWVFWKLHSKINRPRATVPIPC